MPVAAPELDKARTTLDAHVREIMQWHFSPETGCPFWLEWAEKAGWDPRKDVQTYDDLDKFGSFQDEWLRGGPVRRWVPRAYKDKPIYTFETGGSTGVPSPSTDAGVWGSPSPDAIASKTFSSSAPRKTEMIAGGASFAPRR